MTTREEIIKQLENKLDLFAEMMDVLEGGDCVLDMQDINTTDIETLITIIGSFHDKTCARINYVNSDTYTFLEERVFESLFERAT